MTTENENEYLRRVLTTNDDGEIVLNRRAPTGDIGRAMMGNYRPGWGELYDDPDEHDLTPDEREFVEMLHYLNNNFTAAKIVMFDLEGRRFSYVDKSIDDISAGALEWLSREGYRTIHAGTQRRRYNNDEWFTHGYAEFRPYPEEIRSLIRRTDFRRVRNAR